MLIKSLFVFVFVDNLSPEWSERPARNGQTTDSDLVDIAQGCRHRNAEQGRTGQNRDPPADSRQRLGGLDGA